MTHVYNDVTRKASWNHCPGLIVCTYTAAVFSTMYTCTTRIIPVHALILNQTLVTLINQTLVGLISSVSASVRKTTDWFCVWSNDELFDDGISFDCESGVGRSRGDNAAAVVPLLAADVSDVVTSCTGLGCCCFCCHLAGDDVTGDRRWLSLTGRNTASDIWAPAPTYDALRWPPVFCVERCDGVDVDDDDDAVGLLLLATDDDGACCRLWLSDVESIELALLWTLVDGVAPRYCIGIVLPFGI